MRLYFKKIPLSQVSEKVCASPKVSCTRSEVLQTLKELKAAVKDSNYVPEKPTKENPLLSEDYIFNRLDHDEILMDLELQNFVAKVLDTSKGAIKRKQKGLPQEYLYIFKYACELKRKDADISHIPSEKILIYIKINSRKVPYKKVFIVSFHKNNPR